MSYPAEGYKTIWRNKSTLVKKFLDEFHQGRYKVFNVSETPYPAERFDGRVSNYNWQDHHAPPFHLLLRLVNEMYNWLKGKFNLLSKLSSRTSWKRCCNALQLRQRKSWDLVCLPSLLHKILRPDLSMRDAFRQKKVYRWSDWSFLALLGEVYPLFWGFFKWIRKVSRNKNP